VALSNTGDRDSQLVFVIRVNGRVVQRTAPLYGGDTTTIVADLSRYEDQTAVVSLLANGRLLGSRRISVNCESSSPSGGGEGGGAGGGASGGDTGGGGGGGGGTGPTGPS
jgi:hypothetical protein